MRVKEITIEIRRPTVQYGYENHTYNVEIDETEESITDVLRFLHREHRDAMKEVDGDYANYQAIELGGAVEASESF